MQLYGYWRSGASYRVRLALALKGISVEAHAVDLRTGAQRAPEYLAHNPQGFVPTLVLEDGTIITQSVAILEYLEERYPVPALLPPDARGRARVRALSALIGCDVHPLNNLRVLNYLKRDLAQPQAEVDRWIGNWIGAGFAAFEAMLAADSGRGSFSFGGAPSLADCYLVPQVYAARRFAVPLDAYPNILAVDAALQAIPAIEAAAPGRQPDADA